MGQVRFGGIAQLNRNPPVGQDLAQPPELKVDDADDMLAREAVEDDDVVQPIEKLRTKMPVQFAHDRLALRVAIAGFAHLFDQRAADIARHDDDAVGEIDGASLPIGQAAIVKDLQEDVEDVRMRFFDFVEEQTQ